MTLGTDPTPEIKLLFIIGVPRSGTTMLRELLSQHDEVAIPLDELQLLPRLIDVCGVGADFSDPNVVERVIEVVRNSNFLYHMNSKGVGYDFERLRKTIVGANWPSVAAALIREFQPDSNASKILGEKTPANLMQMEQFSKVFPGCLFIHIVRDPRDVCLSMQTVWGKSLYRGAVRWMNYIKYYNAVCNRSEFVERCCEVRYEDLTSRPEYELRRLCEFLCIPFQASMLSLRHGAEKLGKAAGAREIQCGNDGGFRDRLRVNHIRMIESVAWPFLDQYGYMPLFASTPVEVNRFRYHLTAGLDFLNGIRSHIRDKGIVQGVRYRFRQLFSS